ncbi:MAG: AI-2E family transporter [Clostridiales bacterium]|nr:AI-2E family transporter [Clostridiales bacterium]
MDERIRYNHDRATVMALVKYILFVMIAVVLGYLSSRLIVIILPFLLGFVIAKASRHLANLLICFGQFFRRITKREKTYTPTVVADSDTAPQTDTPAEASTPPVKPDARREKHHPVRRFFALLFPSLAKKKRPFKTRLTLIIYAVLVIVILGALSWALVALIGQLNTVLTQLPQWFGSGTLMERVEDIVGNFSEKNGGFLSAEMAASAVDYIEDLLITLESRIPSFVSSVVRGLLSFVGSLPIMLFFVIVVIMSGVYFITDGKKLLRFFARNIKNRAFRHKSFMLLDQLSTTLFRVLGGYLALLIITFFEALVVLYLAGVKYAVILALITAVLDFMPVLGVSATMVPLMVYMLIQGNYVGFLILLAGMAVITIVRRVIEPPILGNAMNMHPLATLFAMIIGVAIWGAIGFLVGPVVLLILVEVLKVFSIDKKLRNFMGRVLKTIED